VSKIVSIDYGTKRVGVAISDSSRKIAFALDTINNELIIPYLQDLLTKEKISTIVVGSPKNLVNKDNDISKEVNSFINTLSQKFSHINIEKYDERFTSVIAKKIILSSGINKKKRKNKSLVDKVSSTIILQDYLETL
tara:strand:+ start:2160 stop:2570 length:411 start_codon:yes stop_codon:yes gene_type:complete